MRKKYSYQKRMKETKIKKTVGKLKKIGRGYKDLVGKTLILFFGCVGVFAKNAIFEMIKFYWRYSYKEKTTQMKMWKIIRELKKFHWKYKNLILLFVSLVVAYFLLKFRPISSFLYDAGLSHLGYATAFIFGMLFTYALTTAPATAVLYNLGQSLNPFLIALFGALGSLISDYLIFRFVRNKLMDEIKLLSEEVNRASKPLIKLVLSDKIKFAIWRNVVPAKQIRIMIWEKVSHSKIWKIIIPIMAGLIIASPLPDEIGVALFGATKVEPKKFAIMSYSFNFLGIFSIAYLGKVF